MSPTSNPSLPLSCAPTFPAASASGMFSMLAQMRPVMQTRPSTSGTRTSSPVLPPQSRQQRQQGLHKLQQILQEAIDLIDDEDF